MIWSSDEQAIGARRVYSIVRGPKIRVSVVRFRPWPPDLIVFEEIVASGSLRRTPHAPHVGACSEKAGQSTFYITNHFALLLVDGQIFGSHYIYALPLDHSTD